MFERPYAAGFNGHAACCDCNLCAPMRAKAFKKWFKEQSKLPDMPDKTRTVFVRPHWRRQPNHLNRQPRYKRELIKMFF